MQAKTLIFQVDISLEKLRPRLVKQKAPTTILYSFAAIQGIIITKYNKCELPSRCIHISLMGVSADRRTMQVLVEVCTELSQDAAISALRHMLGSYLKEVKVTGNFRFEDEIPDPE